MFIEFHPFYFSIKDRKTRKVLLHGPCKGGLYPLPPPTSKFQQLIFSAIRLSIDHWHNRLGHPERDIVLRIIRDNNLLCASLNNASSICDPCLCAKAHQLPFPVSYSRATTPLELIHSDVWDPAIKFFGRKKYYVSFIDDYSKFTWIYLLRRKSEVFQYFLEFQSLVECMFNRKIITVQPNLGGGGASMSALIPFSKRLASHIMFLAPILTNKMAPLNANIAISLRWVCLCLPSTPCHLSTGMKHFLRPPI
jgi:hypothetical protein